VDFGPSEINRSICTLAHGGQFEKTTRGQFAQKVGVNLKWRMGVTLHGISTLEVEATINQVKVAADIDYRYKGDSEAAKKNNKLIDDYSKDRTINIRKRVKASTQHLPDYTEWGKQARSEYVKNNKQNDSNDKKK
jgi:hypothetical protein